MNEDARQETPAREEVYVEGKTRLAETWLMEVERRMRFLVIENHMIQNAFSASTFPIILDATPYLRAGYRCCAAC